MGDEPTLDECIEYRAGWRRVMTDYERRMHDATLSHLRSIPALTARAEAAEADAARLRDLLLRLNAELDAFWNAPAETKCPEGRVNEYYVRSITNIQIECGAVLNPGGTDAE